MEMNVYQIGMEPETQVCLTCRHFYLHYTKDGTPFGRGHCCFPRLKDRKIDDTCDRWEGKH